MIRPLTNFVLSRADERASGFKPLTHLQLESTCAPVTWMNPDLGEGWLILRFAANRQLQMRTNHAVVLRKVGDSQSFRFAVPVTSLSIDWPWATRPVLSM